MTYLLIATVAIIGFVVFYACKPKPSKSEVVESSGVQSEPKPNQNNPFEDLRKLAMSTTAEQLGIEVKENEVKVFGVVMDWDLGNGIATIPAFITGDASMYLSSGGGVIGGGQHDNVKKAVINFIETGQTNLDKAKQVNETPLPDKGMVYFYFLTNKGKYVAKENMTNIENNRSEWIKLFEEANNVISELRIISEKD